MTVHRLVKRFYPESEILGYTFVDGTLAFYSSVRRVMGKNKNEKVLLDLGCGRGAYVLEAGKTDNYLAEARNFKGEVKKVIGIDVDANAASNPSLDEFHLLEIGKPWPLESSSIDVCICDYVVEHVENTAFFFSELYRVMKKQGTACFRTPNKFGYMPIISSLVPNSLHARVLKKVQPDRKEEDVFPVVYKCNTRATFHRLLKENGFNSYVLHYESEPNYLKFSYISFAFGYYLHKILPKPLKATLFAFAIKK
ncbi:hypothetical protein BH10BAC2_BH10BAC2_37580 [soil metagenome]